MKRYHFKPNPKLKVFEPQVMIQPPLGDWGKAIVEEEKVLHAQEAVNYSMRSTTIFVPEIWSKKVLSKFNDAISIHLPVGRSIKEFTGPDLMRAMINRANELRSRHYSDSWIERDLTSLVEGLV